AGRAGRSVRYEWAARIPGADGAGRRRELVGPDCDLRVVVGPVRLLVPLVGRVGPIRARVAAHDRQPVLGVQPDIAGGRDAVARAPLVHGVALLGARVIAGCHGVVDGPGPPNTGVGLHRGAERGRSAA